MRAYNIQRCLIQDRPENKGIDSIINLAYMGASEFEWGALPKSLEAIRSSIGDYLYFNHQVNSIVEVTIFCHSDKFYDMVKYLELLASGEMRTKNGHYFDWVCRGEEKDVNCWWDIDNHLFFWLRDDVFMEKFKLLIAKKPD